MKATWTWITNTQLHDLCAHQLHLIQTGEMATGPSKGNIPGLIGLYRVGKPASSLKEALEAKHQWSPIPADGSNIRRFIRR